MALLQAPLHSASSTAEDQRTCPECLTRYTPAQDAQGMMLAAVARYSRNGTRTNSRAARRASHRIDWLFREWRREDAIEHRMPLVDFIDLRYALGFDAL